MRHAMRIYYSTALYIPHLLNYTVHACSDLGSLHSDAPQANSAIVGFEGNVIAVKAMHPSHNVVAIVGHGKCTFKYWLAQTIL
jgi:hypothetical protein